MRLKARLYLTVAAIGVAAVLAAAPAQLGAQTAVAIDNDDIDGAVTGANWQSPASIITRITTTDSNAPLAITGFLAVPVPSQPSRGASWSSRGGTAAR